MSDSSQMNIRRMRQQDAEPVAELVAQLGYERTPEQVRLWIRGLGSRPEQAAFVAELDGEIVAWIDVSLERRLQSEVFGSHWRPCRSRWPAQPWHRPAPVRRGRGVGAPAGSEEDARHLQDHPRGRPPVLSARRLLSNQDIQALREDAWRLSEPHSHPEQPKSDTMQFATL